jgi:hypothetical protein
MEKKTRTGAELLLDVEQKLDTLLGHVRNLENLQKIMLQRMNEMGAVPTGDPDNENINQVILKRLDDIQEQSKVIFPAPQSTPTHTAEPQPVPGQFVTYDKMPKTNHFEKAMAAAGIVDEEAGRKPVTIKAHPEPPRIPSREDTELEEEFVHQGSRRGMRVQTQPSGKVEVTQQVFYASGKPVVVASVEVLDDRGLLVSQTRTNQTGRWRMGLMPGHYTVHLVKRVAPDSMAQPMELRYNIDVTGEDRKMELPSPEVG